MKLSHYLYSVRHNSMAAAVTYAESHPPLVSYPSSRTKGKTYGCDTWSDAIALAKSGWHEGAEMVRQGIERAAAKSGARKQVVRRRRVCDVAGEEVDVGRFLAGDPENMTETVRYKAAGKTVQIVRVSMAVAQAVTADVIMEYAVVVAACIAKLEASGKRVEVWAEKNCCEDRPDGYGNAGKNNAVWNYAIKVKEASGRLHLAALAVAFHPLFQRRLAFSALEAEPEIKRLCAVTYGMPCNPPDQYADGYLTTRKRFLNNGEMREAIAELQQMQ
jgi:hypothetical protein